MWYEILLAWLQWEERSLPHTAQTQRTNLALILPCTKSRAIPDSSHCEFTAQAKSSSCLAERMDKKEHSKQSSPCFGGPQLQVWLTIPHPLCTWTPAASSKSIYFREEELKNGFDRQAQGDQARRLHLFIATWTHFSTKNSPHMGTLIQNFRPLMFVFPWYIIECRIQV